MDVSLPSNGLKRFLYLNFSFGADGSVEDVTLQDTHKPIREYDIPQGTLLELRGVLKLKSDKPKECFSASFEKGKEMTMDYFTCKGNTTFSPTERLQFQLDM